MVAAVGVGVAAGAATDVAPCEAAGAAAGVLVAGAAVVVAVLAIATAGLAMAMGLAVADDLAAAADLAVLAAAGPVVAHGLATGVTAVSVRFTAGRGCTLSQYSPRKGPTALLHAVRSCSVAGGR